MALIGVGDSRQVYRLIESEERINQSIDLTSTEFDDPKVVRIRAEPEQGQLWDSRIWEVERSFIVGQLKNEE